MNLTLSEIVQIIGLIGAIVKLSQFNSSFVLLQGDVKYMREIMELKHDSLSKRVESLETK